MHRQSRTSDPPEWRPARRIARGKAVFRVHLYCIWLRGVSFLFRALGLHLSNRSLPHLDAVHGFALDAFIVDDVGHLSVLSVDRRGQLIHGVRHRGARSLAENARRGDQRPLAGSERRAVGIQGPRSSRLLGCTTSLHRGMCSPGKHRSADVPHSQLQWSALGAGRSASRFALSRRASPRRAPELRTDRAQALFCPCPSIADLRFARPPWMAVGPSTHLVCTEN